MKRKRRSLKNGKEDQGIWLVDKNSWDDDDDKDGGQVERKCKDDVTKEGKKDDEVVDMDTSDSSDDSETETYVS